MANVPRAQRKNLTASQIAESLSGFGETELLQVLNAIVERLIEFKKLHEAKVEQYQALVAPLGRFDHRFVNKASEFRKRRRFLPKYRNPDNPTQTWSGQGRTPKWMPGSPKELPEAVLKQFRISK